MEFELTENECLMTIERKDRPVLDTSCLNPCAQNDLSFKLEYPFLSQTTKNNCSSYTQLSSLSNNNWNTAFVYHTDADDGGDKDKILHGIIDDESNVYLTSSDEDDTPSSIEEENMSISSNLSSNSFDSDSSEKSQEINETEPSNVNILLRSPRVRNNCENSLPTAASYSRRTFPERFSLIGLRELHEIGRINHCNSYNISPSPGYCGGKLPENILDSSENISTEQFASKCIQKICEMDVNDAHLSSTPNHCERELSPTAEDSQRMTSPEQFDPIILQEISEMQRINHGHLFNAPPSPNLYDKKLPSPTLGDIQRTSTKRFTTMNLQLDFQTPGVADCNKCQDGEYFSVKQPRSEEPYIDFEDISSSLFNQIQQDGTVQASDIAQMQPSTFDTQSDRRFTRTEGNYMGVKHPNIGPDLKDSLHIQQRNLNVTYETPLESNILSKVSLSSCSKIDTEELMSPSSAKAMSATQDNLPISVLENTKTEKKLSLSNLPPFSSLISRNESGCNIDSSSQEICISISKKGELFSNFKPNVSLINDITVCNRDSFGVEILLPNCDDQKLISAPSGDISLEEMTSQLVPFLQNNSSEKELYSLSFLSSIKSFQETSCCDYFELPNMESKWTLTTDKKCSPLPAMTVRAIQNTTKPKLPEARMNSKDFWSAMEKRRAAIREKENKTERTNYDAEVKTGDNNKGDFESRTRSEKEYVLDSYNYKENEPVICESDNKMGRRISNDNSVDNFEIDDYTCFDEDYSSSEEFLEDADFCNSCGFVSESEVNNNSNVMNNSLIKPVERIMTCASCPVDDAGQKDGSPLKRMTPEALNSKESFAFSAPHYVVKMPNPDLICPTCGGTQEGYLMKISEVVPTALKVDEPVIFKFVDSDTDEEEELLIYPKDYLEKIIKTTGRDMSREEMLSKLIENSKFYADNPVGIVTNVRRIRKSLKNKSVIVCSGDNSCNLEDSTESSPNEQDKSPKVSYAGDTSLPISSVNNKRNATVKQLRRKIKQEKSSNQQKFDVSKRFSISFPHLRNDLKYSSSKVDKSTKQGEKDVYLGLRKRSNSQSIPKIDCQNHTDTLSVRESDTQCFYNDHDSSSDSIKKLDITPLRVRNFYTQRNSVQQSKISNGLNSGNRTERKMLFTNRRNNCSQKYPDRNRTLRTSTTNNWEKHNENNSQYLTDCKKCSVVLLHTTNKRQFNISRKSNYACDNKTIASSILKENTNLTNIQKSFTNNSSSHRKQSSLRQFGTNISSGNQSLQAFANGGNSCLAIQRYDYSCMEPLPKLRIPTRKDPSVNEIVSSNFRSFFQFYAKLGGRLKSGSVISKGNSSYWLKKTGVIFDGETAKVAEEYFNVIAKRKLVLNIYDYIQYLAAISKKRNGCLFDLLQQLKSEDISDRGAPIKRNTYHGISEVTIRHRNSSTAGNRPVAPSVKKSSSIQTGSKIPLSFPPLHRLRTR